MRLYFPLESEATVESPTLFADDLPFEGVVLVSKVDWGNKGEYELSVLPSRELLLYRHTCEDKPEFPPSNKNHSQGSVAVSDHPIPFRQWVHVAGVFDGSVCMVFVNGVGSSIDGSVVCNATDPSLQSSTALEMKSKDSGTIYRLKEKNLTNVCNMGPVTGCGEISTWLGGGRTVGRACRQLRGYLANVLVWDHTRSEAEILQSMSG